MKHLVLILLLASPAPADTLRAVDGHILPKVAAFVQAVDQLANAAQADCTRAAVLPEFRKARLAFAAVADLRVGPGEQAGLNMAFWPDPRSSGARALQGYLQMPGDPVLLPVSARGFAGLERLLGDGAFDYGADDPACALVIALSQDLQVQAQSFSVGWQDHAALMRAPGNLTYLDTTEVRRVLFTQALASLELTANARLAEPLGEPDRPRPMRAEHWRTGLSLGIALEATRASVSLAQILSDSPLPQTARLLAEVDARASQITDPSFQDIDNPDAWGRLFGLRRSIGQLHDTLEGEFGAATGLTPGFNSLDGD